MKRNFVLVIVLFTTIVGIGYAGQAAPRSDRFEVSSLKAVRPALVNTIAALQKGDAAGAKAAFQAYDSGWNGVEVYINTRSKEMYDDLEHNYQSRIAEGLNAAAPNTSALLADAKAMLAKYDEAIAMVEKAMPLNRLYDDVARLRIERAHLREVPPALKAGNIAQARKSFEAFNDNWDNIEQLVKERSQQSYDSIEKGMIQIERALMPATPNADEVTGMVNSVMEPYNAVVAQITKEARSAK